MIMSGVDVMGCLTILTLTLDNGVVCNLIDSSTRMAASLIICNSYQDP